MVGIDSAHRPAADGHIPNAGHDGPTGTSAFGASKYVLLPGLGGFFGSVGYIVAALLLEARSEFAGPRLSYGQQFGLISLPLCTLMGAALGFGIALSLARRYLISVVLLVLAALIGWGIVTSMWNEQIARYGRDPSEVVLYYPPLGISILSLAVALAVGLVGAGGRFSSRRHAIGP
jgi:pimeloyl-ACP methyl ester carboxylesterase